MCNRKKMMGRNVNPGLTEPKIKPQALKVFARWQTHTLTDAAKSF